MIDTAHMALGDSMPRAVAAFGGKLWPRDDSETPACRQRFRFRLTPPKEIFTLDSGDGQDRVGAADGGSAGLA